MVSSPPPAPPHQAVLGEEQRALPRPEVKVVQLREERESGRLNYLEIVRDTGKGWRS